MDNIDPDNYVVTEYTCLINYDTGIPRRNLLSQKEIDKLVSEGYTVVTYRQWWDYSEDKFDRDQKRIHKSIQQKLRRQLTPKKMKPKKPNS